MRILSGKLALAAAALACGTALAAPSALDAYNAHQASQPTINAAVMVTTGTGHGSGVHIGRGLFLTAAHVVGDAETATIHSADDNRGAEVLWASEVYDVALLRSSGDGVRVVDIDCATPAIGTPVTAHGNPMLVRFIHTSGDVISPVSDAYVPGGYVVDMTIIPGMSGGPVLNDAGRLVGISTATLAAGGPFVAVPLGIGLVTSSSAICELLGRSA